MKNILHLSCGVLILYILSVVCATVAFANNVEIQYINAGTDRSYVVLSDGSLYTWGEGRSYTTLSYREGDPVRNIPRKIDNGVAASGDTSSSHISWVIRTDGSFWYGSEKLLDQVVSCNGEYI
ncbi:MAG: hypothetical protein IKY52_05555, partial [Clostridia bacterium]|nr:hypothetical protein [Clostridia bacterium]